MLPNGWYGYLPSGKTEDIDTPILMLTLQDDEYDKVIGLEAWCRIIVSHLVLEK